MDELCDFYTEIDDLLNDLKEERLRLRAALRDCAKELGSRLLAWSYMSDDSRFAVWRCRDCGAELVVPLRINGALPLEPDERGGFKHNPGCKGMGVIAKAREVLGE